MNMIQVTCVVDNGVKRDSNYLRDHNQAPNGAFSAYQWIGPGYKHSDYDQTFWVRCHFSNVNHCDYG